MNDGCNGWGSLVPGEPFRRLRNQDSPRFKAKVCKDLLVKIPVFTGGISYPQNSKEPQVVAGKKKNTGLQVFMGSRRYCQLILNNADPSSSSSIYISNQGSS